MFYYLQVATTSGVASFSITEDGDLKIEHNDFDGTSLQYNEDIIISNVEEFIQKITSLIGISK